MNGIKEGMEYLVEESKPIFQEYEGKLFANKQLYRVHNKEPMAESLQLSTLTSLVDYIVESRDALPNDMIIHVESPTRVRLFGMLNTDRERELLVTVNPDVPKFNFGEFLTAEEFIISIQSMFLDGGDKKQILKYVGTAQTGTVKDYGDDGVLQSATIQKTTTSREEAIIPNPVVLTPYRTFHEVEQPASPFIFRMKDYANSLGAALFEADGGAWRITATSRVAEWLRSELEERLKHSENADKRNVLVIS